MSYSYTVSLPYNAITLFEITDWAKENCSSYITNKACKIEQTSVDGVVYCAYNIEYYFCNERDAVAFILRWR